jgi:hypothetical protein
MTCFWEGITSKLSNQLLGETCKTRNYSKFITYLQQNSREILKAETLVSWNGEKLTEQYLSEQEEHIKSYNISKIGDGHDCSICDPFLILISVLFRVNIIHNYNNHVIGYIRQNAKTTLSCSSNIGHFW